jgi:predicted O-methyltransferase YrrM
MTTIEPFVLWPQVVINNMEYLDRLCILQMTSDMACKVLEGLYDFIFIDGEHEYGQCKRDILNYRKFIKSGGIIAGHNFETHARAAHPGVAKAVIEIFADNFKLTKTDCVWYVEV